MDEHYVWMTIRRITPGTLGDFERAWKPDSHPAGMLRSYVYWSDDEEEVVGVSFWESREACDQWRRSEGEARRRERMAPYVIDERETYYRGRELHVPTH